MCVCVCVCACACGCACEREGRGGGGWGERGRRNGSELTCENKHTERLKTMNT